MGLKPVQVLPIVLPESLCLW